jgi:8-oxo-dGTP diphosphatase
MGTMQSIRSRNILKIGLAVTESDRVLLVKKRGSQCFILPGGKPEVGEADLETLRREIWEELGCTLDANSVEFLGSFTDQAAEIADATVTVKLYKGHLLGRPSPKSEIETLRWVTNREDPSSLAPSLRNQILPFLFAKAVASQEGQ